MMRDDAGHVASYSRKSVHGRELVLHDEDRHVARRGEGRRSGDTQEIPGRYPGNTTYGGSAYGGNPMEAMHMEAMHMEAIQTGGNSDGRQCIRLHHADAYECTMRMHTDACVRIRMHHADACRCTTDARRAGCAGGESEEETRHPPAHCPRKTVIGVRALLIGAVHIGCRPAHAITGGQGSAVGGISTELGRQSGREPRSRPRLLRSRCAGCRHTYAEIYLYSARMQIKAHR